MRGWKAVVAAFTPTPSDRLPGRDPDAVVRLARVRAMHAETRQRDGSRRMATPLQADGFPVGRSQARRVMQEAGVAVRHRQRGPITPDSRHGSAVAPNLWARQCEVETSDMVWARDITSLWTADDWCYWAAWLD